MATPLRLVVSGFPSCPYFQKAKTYALEKASDSVLVRIVQLEREPFHAFRQATLKELKLPESHHTTCPFNYLESEKQVPETFIGGFDNLRSSSLFQ